MAGPATLYQTGDHASRPANGSGCVLYSCTTHSLIYLDDGSAWTTFATITSGSAAAGDITFTPAGTIAATDVQAAIEEVATEAGAIAGVGKAPFAGPIGWSTQLTSTGNYGLAASGGSLAVPIYVAAPMVGQGLAIINGDTTLSRTCEFRLYTDGGDSTADFVTGTDGTMSFTAAAIAIQRGAFSGAPVTLQPGWYWAVVRNTGGSNTFSIRRGSGALAGYYSCQSGTIGSALGASQELRTGWTTEISVPHLWIEGRVLGLTTALT